MALEAFTVSIWQMLLQKICIINTMPLLPCILGGSITSCTLCLGLSKFRFNARLTPINGWVLSQQIDGCQRTTLRASLALVRPQRQCCTLPVSSLFLLYSKFAELVIFIIYSKTYTEEEEEGAYDCQGPQILRFG